MYSGNYAGLDDGYYQIVHHRACQAEAFGLSLTDLGFENTILADYIVVTKK